MERVIRTESLCNEPQHLESPRGARGAAAHGSRCSPFACSRPLAPLGASQRLAARFGRSAPSVLVPDDSLRSSSDVRLTSFGSPSPGHRRAPLALSVRQGQPAGKPISWWTERARPGPGSTATQAPQRSEERSEPRDRSRPRAFEVLTSSQSSPPRTDTYTAYSQRFRGGEPRGCEPLYDAVTKAILARRGTARQHRRTAPPGPTTRGPGRAASRTPRRTDGECWGSRSRT